MTAPHDQAESWRPSRWLRALVAAAPAPWPVGRSVRAAVGVGVPLLVSALADRPQLGMWVSMGVLMPTIGERPVGYAARFRRILVTTPVASIGFALGLLSGAPHAVTVGVMALVAFVSGVLSDYSATLSAATMQTMLIAAVSIGIPATEPDWRAAVLFFTGALLYVGLLGVEAAVERRRPQREALAVMLNRLADLARAQADGVRDLGGARARAIAAMDSYERLVIARRAVSEGPTREFDRAARISRAADQLLARLLAEDAVPGLSALAATRLSELASAVVHHRRPGSGGIAPDTLVRVHMLESAIWGDEDGPRRAIAAPARRRPAWPGRAVLASAARLSLCTALAYTAYFLLPFQHGYWIPLTVALVMKPDFGSIFSRAVLRSIGTVGGAVIAVTVGIVADGPVLTAVLVALLAAVLPWAKARSYLWQALFLTPLIMILIDLVMPDASLFGIGFDRVVTTVIGGLIVVVAGYLVWPSARHVQVATPFGAAVKALAHYAADVAAGAEPEVISADRRDAYRRLSDTRVSLQRTLSEPPPAGAEASAWIPVIAAAEAVADRITGASASRAPAAPPSAAELSALADVLSTMDAGPQHGNESRTRDPVRSVHGDFSSDPTVRELADEIARLQSMLVRGEQRTS